MLLPSPSLMEMLTRLIAAPSVSSVNPRFDMPNRTVIDLLAAWLESAGFAVRVQALSEGKANLIAQLGAGEGGLAICGHTDTVPYDEGRWRSDPFVLTEREGKLYGLGTCDMKGFLAIAIEVVRGLSARELRHPLLIIATADEESSMTGARKLAELEPLPVRQAIIGEPTSLKPIRQHKGVLMEGIRLIGRSGHSSNPALGNSALEGMHEVISALMHFRDELAQRHRQEDFAVPIPTLNFGHIIGGDNPNRICGQCELHVDLRILPGMEIDAVREDLRARASEVAGRRGLNCEFSALFPGTPSFSTHASAPVARAAESLSGHVCGSVAFATEGPYLNALGIETIVLGPGDIACAHQPDEHLALAEIPQTIELLRGLIGKFCAA